MISHEAQGSYIISFKNTDTGLVCCHQDLHKTSNISILALVFRTELQKSVLQLQRVLKCQGSSAGSKPVKKADCRFADTRDAVSKNMEADAKLRDTEHAHGSRLSALCICCRQPFLPQRWAEKHCLCIWHFASPPFSGLDIPHKIPA